MPLARAFVLLAVSLLPLAGASAQGATVEVDSDALVFERATRVEAAMPQSSAYSILQDQRGFLWFSTREGLGRWDGYTMRTWRRDPFDSASLAGNVVRQMVLDGAGDLWVHTERTDRAPEGVVRLIGPDHERVQRYGHPGARLFIGPEGRAWLADSTHLRRFSPEADRFEPVRERSTNDPATRGLGASDGTIWLTSASGVERYASGARGLGTGEAHLLRAPSLLRPADNEYAFEQALAEDASGRIWASGAGLGYVEGDEIIQVDAPAPMIQGYGEGLAAGVLLPEPGILWLGTLDGVYRYRIPADDPASGEWERYSLRLPGDIPTQNWVTGLHRDRAGTLWAGTVWGLHRAVPRQSPFRLLAHDPDDPNTIGSGIVLSIEEDASGTLWVGTLGGGLNRIGTDGTVTRYRHDPGDPTTLAHDWIWSVEADADTLWIGTGEGLNALALAAPSRIERIPYPPEAREGWGPSAAGLHLDTEGALWYGHAGRLNRRAASGALETFALPEPVGVQDVKTVPEGAWVSTSGGLLFYTAEGGAPRRWQHDPSNPASLPDDASIGLHLDGSDHLWVGTQSGLARMGAASDTPPHGESPSGDPASGGGGFATLTTDDGLPSAAVYEMLEDDDGRIWVSTNRGLARIDPDAPEALVRAYTEADGVGNVEFNRGAAVRGADGTMYFGGDRGVTVFHPADLRESPYVPPVAITALHRSGREGTETQRYVGDEEIALAPGVTAFTFEFAALGFAAPERYRYAVWLDGWDEGWVEIGTRREATYTNLPPGRYTFRVRAANEDGVWSDEATSVPVLVRPSFWESTGFRLLAGLAFVAAVAGAGWGLSRRRYRRELAALRAKQALDAERARISRDMHDEVGASLSEIAILSELAQLSASGGDGAPASGLSASGGLSPSAPGPPPEARRLRKIAETSRETLDSIAEIIWAINPTNDRLPTLAGYLREHAARYAETAGLRATLRFPAHPPDRPVSAEVRRNVFLVLKEALHNVVKHAGATAVDVSLLVEGDALTLIVADDGEGFAPGASVSGGSASGDGVPASVRGGNGLGNMRVRAAEIGGALRIETSEAGGTVVRLRVPLAPEAVANRTSV